LIDSTFKIWAQAKLLILVNRSKTIFADDEMAYAPVDAYAYAGAMA